MIAFLERLFRLKTKKEYRKPALTFDEQAGLLLSRGLIGDRALLIQRLEAVNYYRLSGYLYPFRKKEGDRVLDEFRAGTSLEVVWNRYCFDRRLRMLVLDAIERFEVSLRTKLSHKFSTKFGPFGYCHQKNLPKFSNKGYLDWRLALELETSRSKEEFCRHFKNTYHHPQLPLWMVAELMTAGSLREFFKSVDDDLRKSIANEYGIADATLYNWVVSLFYVRNICAHHARLWNRQLATQPGFPDHRKNKWWPEGFSIKNDRSGAILMICCYLLRIISPSSCWRSRVAGLFAEYPDVPKEEMGLPDNWAAHPVWCGSGKLDIVAHHNVPDLSSHTVPGEF